MDNFYFLNVSAEITEDVKKPVWTDWSAWGPCKGTCGESTQQRGRFCLQGICEGNDLEERQCAHLNPCPGTLFLLCILTHDWFNTIASLGHCGLCNILAAMGTVAIRELIGRHCDKCLLLLQLMAAGEIGTTGNNAA